MRTWPGCFSSVALVSFLIGLPSAAEATITQFADNPATNSLDWQTAVLANGGVIEEIDFDDHPTGPLQNSFYSASHGVTFARTGDFSNVVFGSGPGQAGTSSPRSTGEGPHLVSNYLEADNVLSTLTITFDDPVQAAGLFVIDLFNPAFRNNVSLAAYSGPAASGSLLSTLQSSEFNFQRNNLYFFGLTSTSAGIGSVQLVHPGISADRIGVDNIRFARVPEPTTCALILGSLAVVSLGRGRRSR